MELAELRKRQSYLNIDLMNNYMMAFDIALSKKFINRKYFIDNMMFMEATNFNQNINLSNKKYLFGS